MAAQPNTPDEEPTHEDIAAAIRDADDKTAWEAFGKDVQDAVINSDADDDEWVGVTLTISPELIGIRGIHPSAFRVAVTWEAGSREFLQDRLGDRADALLTFGSSRASVATVDRVREQLADAVEDN